VHLRLRRDLAVLAMLQKNYTSRKYLLLSRGPPRAFKLPRRSDEATNDCKMCSVLRPEPSPYCVRAILPKGGACLPLLDTPCGWGAAAASSLSAPEQRMAVASPVRAFLPRHPDQACRAWIATGEAAALSGTPSGKAETSLSPCIPIDQGACLPPWNPAASSGDLMHVAR